MLDQFLHNIEAWMVSEWPSTWEYIECFLCITDTIFLWILRNSESVARNEKYLQFFEKILLNFEWYLI